MDPYHEGEQAIQELTGERDRALANGRNVNDRIPAAARRFVSQQQFLLLGWRAPEGDLWAALVAGPQGFASAEADGERLRIALDDPRGVLPAIPPVARLAGGDHLGVLFIEPATRRRLRVNGRVLEVRDDELVVGTDHAYGLCPKYIQRRRLNDAPASEIDTSVRTGTVLDARLRQCIRSADTFFVASAHPDGPTDVSHRGGRRGFLQVHDNVLRVPDYPGNSMFNTLGNFALNPRAGLVFVDFAGNRQLQLTGAVELELDAGERDGPTGGTGRWWAFRTDHWQESPLNRPFNWEQVDESPFNP